MKWLRERSGVAGVFLIAVLALMVWAPQAWAQNSNSGTVVGQITDAQGRAMVGAVVTLTNSATNGAQATISNAQGRYLFVNLQPGTYSLDVKAQGFKEAAVKNQLVTVGKQLTLNVPMQVGSAAQTVEVTASGAELQTMNSTVGDTISGDAILMLPNPGRDANALTQLQPNTAPNGAVAGAAIDENSYTLDGGSNSDDMDGAHTVYNANRGAPNSGVIPTPAESVEQFTVGVDNQSADINSAAGSSVAMVTKRGQDAIHGSAYDYYLGSYLGANSWSNNKKGAPKPKSHQNRFGGSLGGPILPHWLGGKTYLYGLFEGRRFPNYGTYERDVPTALLEAGVVQADNGTGTVGKYNITPSTVTVNGTAYQPALCTLPQGGTGACDPRGLGMNPVIAQLWKQYMPPPNDPTAGDTFNTQGFLSSLNTSLKSNFFVTRMDHDFGSKNHFNATYHFYSYNPIVSNQVDIGGAIPGNKLGTPVATTQRPELPSMATGNWTSSLSTNLTNSFTYSYLRNFWQWGGSYLNPTPLQGGFGALGGALEVGGEQGSPNSGTNALNPYNVDTQDVRTRFWDGIGHTFSDDVTDIHGNHIFQFGGKYTHQWDYHERNDNGGGIMAATVYQVGFGSGVAMNYFPTDFTAKADTTTFENAYAEDLGIVNQPQTLYTRAGPKLALQPLGTPMFDQSLIPLYNVYFSDAWHLRPSLTLTYGTGYTVEMPPVEAQGKQVELVNVAGNLLNTQDYFATTERAALAGQAYNPTLGFATVGNVGAGLKYPYRPFYGGLSPRISLAWNPNIGAGWLGALFGGNKSVIRGGWSRIYGRLNGVDLVLVPLLGTGLGQPVACLGANNGNANSLGVTPGSVCNGSGGADPLNAFRIGPTSLGFDGMTAPLGAPPTPTLPQPYFGGELQNGVVNPSAGAGEVLDPNFRPNRSDEFDLTVQRQITPNFSTEIGYTGRVIRNEYEGINLDATPYMLTAGGQQFQSAFAGLFNQLAAGAAVTAQPFFEAALGGATSPFCSKATSCTAAVAAAYGTGKGGKKFIDPVNGNNVYALWAALNASSSWTLGRTFASAPTTCSPTGVGGCPANGVVSGSGQVQAIFTNASLGWGNYNALFWSVNMRNWHGLTALSNFTWSRAMGTGQLYQARSEATVPDPFNQHAQYGPQTEDTPLNYNLYFVYQPGSRTQNGWLARLAHGWSFAPIFTWNDGGWTAVGNGGDCASWGEGDCSAESTLERAVMKNGYTGGNDYLANVTNASVGARSNASLGGTGMNRFGSNAAAIYSEFRPIVLGVDTTSWSGHIPALHYWDMAFSVDKDVLISERFGADLSAQATNVFNHFQAAAYSLNINNPRNFGAISGDAENPRTVEVGLRIHW